MSMVRTLIVAPYVFQERKSKFIEQQNHDQTDHNRRNVDGLRNGTKTKSKLEIPQFQPCIIMLLSKVIKRELHLQQS